MERGPSRRGGRGREPPLENLTPRMHVEQAWNWRDDTAEDLNDQAQSGGHDSPEARGDGRATGRQ